MKVKLNNYPKVGSRKADVQIDRFDSWNLDGTLAIIILPLLIQLKYSKQGVPNDFADVGGASWEAQESFDFYKESHNDAFEEGCKRWEEVLDKMIWSFQQIALEDYDEKYHHGDAKFDWIKTNKQFPNPITGKLEDTFQMVDKNPDDHWYDVVGHLEHEKRIQEGLELFGKYYRNLWD